MKKIIFIFSICFSVCMLNMQSANASQLHVINAEKKLNTVEPKAIETYTISHDMGIPYSDGSSITWKATLTYNPTENKMILSKMTATPHFSYTRPAWSLKSFSCKQVGTNVLHEGYVYIDYVIHTVGSVNISDTYDFYLN